MIELYVMKNEMIVDQNFFSVIRISKGKIR